MKNSRIVLLAIMASFGVYATGNTGMEIDITPEMMNSRLKANSGINQSINNDSSLIVQDMNKRDLMVRLDDISHRQSVRPKTFIDSHVSKDVYPTKRNAGNE